MKKIFAALMTATMILSAGCGEKVEDVKKDAAGTVEQTAADVASKTPTNDKVAPTNSTVAPTNGNVDEKFSLEGISPGMNFDEVKQILGEPVSQHDDDEFTFANGLMIEVERNIVEEIKIRQAGVKTAGGIEVGMTEQNLIDAYGRANSTENDDGVVEHKYYSGDRRLKMKFDVSNGTIVEIKCSLRD